MEARRAGRRRRKGWAAASSVQGHIVSPRAQLVNVKHHTAGGRGK